MKRIVFILTIISSVICSCNSKAANQQKSQKNTKEITEQNIAILAARCVNAIQNKEKNWDNFNFCETISKLCKEFGMSSHVCSQSELAKAGGFPEEEVAKADFYEGMIHHIVGKDSLAIVMTTIAMEYSIGVKTATVAFIIANPIQYGAIVPNQYKNAIYEEFRKQGWYKEDYDRFWFGSNNIQLTEPKYTNTAYTFSITYLILPD